MIEKENSYKEKFQERQIFNLKKQHFLSDFLFKVLIGVQTFKKHI